METFEEFWTKSFYSDYVSGIDKLIKEAIAKKGFDPDDQAFIAEHIQIVRYEHDRFDHYYFHFGQPDQSRLISIQHEPTIDMGTGINYDPAEGYRASITADYY